MAKVAGFRSEEARIDFLDKYDRAVAELWPVPAVEEDVDTSFGTTHVRRSGPTGDRPPLVLIPPHTATSLSWHRLVGPLAAERHVIAVDTVGAAGRSVQRRPFTAPADYGAWLAELIDRLQLGPVHVAGYSQGGWLALCCGLGAADRLRSVIAIEPGGVLARIRPRFLGAMVWAGLRAQLDKRVLREFAERLSPGTDIPEAEWDMALSGMFGFRTAVLQPKRFSDEQLRALRDLPLLLYMGAETELYDPHAVAERARRLLPNAESVIVEHAQHGLPFQYPDRTSAAVLAFLERHDTTGVR